MTAMHVQDILEKMARITIYFEVHRTQYHTDFFFKNLLLCFHSQKTVHGRNMGIFTKTCWRWNWLQLGAESRGNDLNIYLSHRLPQTITPEVRKVQTQFFKHKNYSPHRTAFFFFCFVPIFPDSTQEKS